VKESFFIKVTLFFTGAAIMVIELLGTRIIGPYFGAGLYVWSSLITVTLTALAIGYWLGGKAADKRPDAAALYFSIFLAGLWLILVPSMAGPGLTASRILGIKWGSLAGAFSLFAVPLALLGAVTPFAVKITTRELKVLGTAAGNLYAISTVGSVAGAVLTGFVLIPNFGVKKIIYLQSLILILLWAGHLVVRKKYRKGLFSIPFLAVCVFNWQAGQKLFTGEKAKVIYKTESLYGEVKVVDKNQERWLLIDGTGHTVIDKKTGESLFEYSFYFELLPLIKPGAEEALLIGLGGGVIPRALSELGLEMDIVEIDGNVEYAARKYFNFTDKDGKVYIGDGRDYLTGTGKKYDFVVLDAYSGDRLPFHLVSVEGFRRMGEVLRDNGVLAINCPGFLGGKNSLVWKSIYRTLKEVFPEVRVFTREWGKRIGSIIFLASEKEIKMRKRIEGNYRTEISKRFLTFNPLDLMGAGTSEALRKTILRIFPSGVLLD